MKKILSSGYTGMVLCFISSLLLSLGTMMVSRMPQYHPITKSFWRFAGTFVPSLFVVVFYAFREESISSSFWPLRKKSFTVLISLIFRSIFGCTAATFQYYSLKYMPLGDSAVICNSYPIFVTLLAYLFLGEAFGGLFMFLSTLVTLGGVVLITRPPILTGDEFDTNILIGCGLAVSCSIFMAMAIVMIRHLKEIHHSITLVGFGGFGTVEAALLAYGFDVLEFPMEPLYIAEAVAIGLLSCASQMFLIFALKCDNAGPVALVKTTDVLFAFLWQMVFVQIMPDLISVVGGVIMMGGIFLCGFKKYIDSLDEVHPHKKLFWFVLK